MIAAIDFTGSNGDPDLPSSLHYISPTGEWPPPSFHSAWLACFVYFSVSIES